MSPRRRQDSELDLEAVGHAEDRLDADEGAESSDGGAGEQSSAEGSDPMSDLQQELGELQLKYQRALADYRNYQQRALANEQEARKGGAADVLRTVIRSLDYFDMALSQDPTKATAEQILGGVRMIKEDLLRALGEQGVVPIEPEVNQEFDPNRHEAVQRIEAEGVHPGHIAHVVQPGYALGDRVLRPARVAVAPAESAPEARRDEGAESADEEDSE